MAFEVPEGQGTNIPVELVVRRMGAAIPSSSAVRAAGDPMLFSYRAPAIDEVVVKELETPEGIPTGVREIEILGSSFGPSPSVLLDNLPQALSSASHAKIVMQTGAI